MLYLCDPAENKRCRKSGCFYKGGECFLTTREECKIKDTSALEIDENGDIKAVEYEQSGT